MKDASGIDFSAKPKYYYCTICNNYHPLEWDGDCRDDNNRFSADDLDEKHGGAHKWEEVPMPI